MLGTLKITLFKPFEGNIVSQGYCKTVSLTERLIGQQCIEIQWILLSS